MTTIGFEEKLWQAADKLRGSMDAAEYKNVALGNDLPLIKLFLSNMMLSGSNSLLILCIK